MNTLDNFDLRLLYALQIDGRSSHADLAERVRLSPSQISRRIQRLEQQGFIDRHVTLLSSEKLGLDVRAYVTIVMKSHAETEIESFRERLLRLPEVQECCKITGDADYLLKVTTTDLKNYNRILTEYLLKAPEVASVRSGIVLEEIKNTTELPLPQPRAKRRERR